MLTTIFSTLPGAEKVPKKARGPCGRIEKSQGAPAFAETISPNDNLDVGWLGVIPIHTYTSYTSTSIHVSPNRTQQPKTLKIQGSNKGRWGYSWLNRSSPPGGRIFFQAGKEMGNEAWHVYHVYIYYIYIIQIYIYTYLYLDHPRVSNFSPQICFCSLRGKHFTPLEDASTY